MIIEGVKLALLGMLVVFSFLVLLVLMVKVTSQLLKELTAKEAAHMVSSVKKPMTSVEQEGKVIGIIGAALAAHRARYGNRHRSGANTSTR